MIKNIIIDCVAYLAIVVIMVCTTGLN